MKINEYQKLAMTTLNKDLNGNDILINGVMGLCGEAGEVIDLVKKHLHQGHSLNKDQLVKELGDVAWYLAEIAYAINVDLETVLSLNIEKLKKRFPNGFEIEKSINRENE
jgi:NTP pyrophosphatase (non-canonical NTP hydrolase)